LVTENQDNPQLLVIGGFPHLQALARRLLPIGFNAVFAVKKL
jgi:hypothetical protein